MEELAYRPETYVVFHIGRQKYALPLHCVSRAVRMVALTPAPEAKPWIKGVINIGGHIVPVIDLAQRLGLSSHEPELNNRLLVVEQNRETVAVIVDDVLDITKPDSMNFELHSARMMQSKFLAGIIHQAGEMILVLDNERLLAVETSERVI